MSMVSSVPVEMAVFVVRTSICPGPAEGISAGWTST